MGKYEVKVWRVRAGGCRVDSVGLRDLVMLLALQISGPK